MPVNDPQAADVQVRAGRRQRLIDPLLPDRVEGLPGCDERFFATGSDGSLTATGRCEHWTGEPGSLDLVWGAQRRFRLIPEIAGPDAAGALGQLMDQWREHLAKVPDADAADTAAIVNWPSRDIDGIRPLLARGLSPTDVVTARLTAAAEERPQDESVAGQAVVSLRQAGPADVGVVARFGREEVRFDAHFGGVIDRPNTEDSFRRYAAELLAGPDPWVWLAERDGSVVGALIAEHPREATWIAPLTTLSPVAYLLSMFVVPAHRGAGIGAMLTRQFHREVRSAGIPVALLHYAVLNPLSVPFWSRQGYRPLWTTLEARPALSLHAAAGNSQERKSAAGNEVAS